MTTGTHLYSLGYHACRDQWSVMFGRLVNHLAAVRKRNPGYTSAAQLSSAHGLRDPCCCRGATVGWHRWQLRWLELRVPSNKHKFVPGKRCSSSRFHRFPETRLPLLTVQLPPPPSSLPSPPPPPLLLLLPLFPRSTAGVYTRSSPAFFLLYCTVKFSLQYRHSKLISGYGCVDHLCSERKHDTGSSHTVKLLSFNA